MNRWAFYGMTILSCIFLATMFWSRSQILPAVIVTGVGLFYLVRGVISDRQDRTQRRVAAEEKAAGPTTTAEQRATLAELRETRRRLRGSRQRQIILGLAFVVGIVYFYPVIPGLAIALGLALLPVSYLLIRATRAINVIENGLALRGLAFEQ